MLETNNWRHIQETINMLYLAICQIEATMADSNNSVDTLTQSFVRLAEHTSDMSSHLQEVNETAALDSFKKEMVLTADEMQTNIKSSVQAFQFYDRICQRLDHIAGSLQKVTEIVSDEQARNSDLAWKNIQQTIKSSYTMEAERIMFEYIMRGSSVAEALEVYRHHFDENSENVDQDGDEIELF